MSSLRNSYERITSRYPKPDSGYIRYNDDQYDSGNVLTINEGSIVKVPNNATSTIGDNIDLPLYDGNKLTPNFINDNYILRVNFTAYMSTINGGFSLGIDISETGDGSEIIASIPVRTIRGSGSGTAVPYSIDIPFYSSGTFIANGGRVLVEALTGDISVYDISFILFKLHSGES